VESAGDSRVILQEGVEIMAASDSSHVHGPVFQTGTGRKLFPIGNGSIYLPVELTDVTDASALIGVELFEFENSSLARPEDLTSIGKRYWYIDVASGTLSNSPVILPLRDEALMGSDEEIVVVQSDSPTDVFTSIGGLRATGGRNGATITSKMNVSMPFVALATAAKEVELVVYNAVSNNGDGKNDFMIIENIQSYPGNKLSVFNRWGDKVFEIENYDNHERVFRGRTNIGGESDLVSGTYFYVIDVPEQESLRGFIAIKN
jgi:gliding motility-associated-like protein